ncbi:MAG: hypothetical protein K2I40_08960 [Bifidobacterium castoris]|nr:hypothetical protein [Bifidobacterium castoris]
MATEIVSNIMLFLFAILGISVLLSNFMEPVHRTRKSMRVIQEGYLRAAEMHGDSSADVNAITVEPCRNRTLAWAWENGYMDYLDSRGLTPDDKDMKLLTNNPYVKEDATNALLCATHSRYNHIK